jgi:hypothetical protein
MLSGLSSPKGDKAVCGNVVLAYTFLYRQVGAGCVLACTKERAFAGFSPFFVEESFCFSNSTRIGSNFV